MAGPADISWRNCNSVSAFLLIVAEKEEIPADIHRDHVGVHDQKQPGLVYVGASVLRGRITPQQLNLAADLADRYADGHVRNTGCKTC